MHETDSQFRDKYDIKSFEHTTVLTSALHNVHQSKQNHVFVYLWNYLYLAIQLFICGQILSIPVWYSPRCHVVVVVVMHVISICVRFCVWLAVGLMTEVIVSVLHGDYVCTTLFDGCNMTTCKVGLLWNWMPFLSPLSLHGRDKQ